MTCGIDFKDRHLQIISSLNHFGPARQYSSQLNKNDLQIYQITKLINIIIKVFSTSSIACNRKLNQPNQNRISKYRRKPDIFLFCHLWSLQICEITVIYIATV